ncbi:Glycosyltransferase involved in cell wall bisynthesis [Parapedobacter luteus]|uniref:Glycosyltransferase involved in cell wall bisynthesis n=1 Tax=Parapedobacter luteus TaxID=623280 RepID=A0A1T5FQB8_9SPHI|nr:glycosyltransferase family 1 protein [Parapedobacter luteus]SKB98378.1 Glycosyltransferase involved in cell wall bisynthesis [Parapedobacter luteus]
MNILFICGTLEPGKDGVGDYTRRLAAELIRQGHSANVMSIHDKYVSQTSFGYQEDNDVQVRMIRLAKKITWKKRIIEACKFLDDLEPDWISLQYVPYSFHNKGLPFKAIRQLQRLGNEKKWHIMFHELWLGVKGDVPIKQRPIQILQKLSVNMLIRQLKANLITTSIPIYQHALGKHNAFILPLFSNIPVSKKQITTQKNPDNDTLKIIHFGSFTPALNDFAAQLNWVKAFTTKQHKKAIFILLGNGGPLEQQSIEMIQSTFGKKAIKHLGQLVPEKVSEWIQMADLGISRADYTLYGKSGSTLCLLEHGIPVLLRGSRPVTNTKNWKPLEEDSRFIFCDSPIASLPVKNSPQERLPLISKTFLSYLYTNNEL